MMRMRFRNLALPRGGGAPAPPEVAAPKFRPAPVIRSDLGRRCARGRRPEGRRRRLLPASHNPARAGGLCVTRLAAGESPSGRCSVGDVVERRGDEFTSPPDRPAARSGGAGLTAAALESAAEGELFALRNTCAGCVWGGQQRARGRRSPPAFGAHVSGHYAALRAAAHSSCGAGRTPSAVGGSVFGVRCGRFASL